MTMRILLVSETFYEWIHHHSLRVTVSSEFPKGFRRFSILLNNYGIILAFIAL